MDNSSGLKKKAAGRYSQLLNTAVARDDEDAVKKLLEAVVDSTNIKKKKCVLDQVLRAASEQGNENIVTMLIGAGADASAKTGSCQALCKVIRQRRNNAQVGHIIGNTTRF